MSTDPPPSSLARRLTARWRGSEGAPLADRSKKAVHYAADLARARVYLRSAELLAPNVRVVGRPIVNSQGHLRIGDRTVFRSIVAPVEITVAEGASMSIGNDTHINSGTTICAYSSVEIGNRVEVAPYVSIYDTNFHQLYDRNALPDPEPVVIEDDVWLCAKCTVLPGVRIGRGAVVSAHALVQRDVEPFTVVSGVPASVVKQLDPERFRVHDPGNW